MKSDFIKAIIPKPIYCYHAAWKLKKIQRKRIQEIAKAVHGCDAELGVAILQKGYISCFYGDWTRKYDRFSAIVKWDSDANRYYVLHKTLFGGRKRIYYKKGTKSMEAFLAYRSVALEQDPCSPHRYLSETVIKKICDDRGIGLDIGTAEGNFSLDVIDCLDGIICFEPEAEWVDALTLTMKPYGNRVKIEKKFVAGETFGDYTSIDDYFGSEIPNNIRIIKMDIEGSEMEALNGMKKTLQENPEAVLLVCLYHNKDDEKEIKRFLEDMGYEFRIRDGVMLFGNIDTENICDNIRHGVLEAWKER